MQHPSRLMRCLQQYVRGQAVSSRPDLLPPSYTDELEKLQDEIPPFSDVDAMRTLTSELGQSPTAMFSELTPSPVAAASLGQVRAEPSAEIFPAICTATRAQY